MKKAVTEITDRAKRYRANRNPPPGPRRCNFCARRKNVDIDHITGDESDGEPGNLIYLCRPCNTSKAIVQTRNRIGVRTHQYNPSRPATFAQFKSAAAVLLGLKEGDAGEATRAIRATSPAQRVKFGDQIENETSRNPEAPTFAQYARAVSIHARGAHDEGGSIIHATPPALRSRYARQIARGKKARLQEVPF